MQEIITQYDTCKVNIYDKEYNLVTKIIQWTKLKNQNLKYINRLKNNGEIIQYFKIMNPNGKSKNKTIGCYYILYATKIIDTKYRNILINKILNKNIKDKGILRKYIQYMWETRNGIKTSKFELNDKESVILSMMAYYICDGYDEDYKILSPKDEEEIRKKEVASFKDMSDDKVGDGNYKTDGLKNGWSYDISSKSNMKKFKKANLGATNKWKHTKTYNQNDIVSYDNLRADKYHWQRSGLINHEKPYCSKWCIVDIDNIFKYCDCTYKISEDVKQYSVSKDNKTTMDKILVYEQDDKLFFFDQNIEQIDNNKIFILNKIKI